MQHSEKNLLVISYLFAGNEGHEDVITDCGGSNVGTGCIKLGVAKFLPVLEKINKQNKKKNPPTLF